MMYHKVSNKINTTGATCGAGTSGATEFTDGFFSLGFVLIDN